MELSYLPCISVVTNRMVLGRILRKIVQADSCSVRINRNSNDEAYPQRRNSLRGYRKMRRSNLADSEATELLELCIYRMND